MDRYIRLFYVIAILSFLSFFLSACGKNGMPHPYSSSKSFSWDGVAATPVGDCLAFSGKLSGSYENLDKIRLEIAPINGPEDCPGCPFVPKEIAFLSYQDVGLERTSGEILFSYCPSPAKSYRWRLSGINKFSTIPHAISYELTTEMPETKK